jgi:hypothetical protein
MDVYDRSYQCSDRNFSWEIGTAWHSFWTHYSLLDKCNVDAKLAASVWSHQDCSTCWRRGLFGKDGRTACLHQQQGNTRAQARPQPDAVGDPLAASRVTLIGNVLPVPEAEVAEARKRYLSVMRTARTGWTLTILAFTK